MEQEQLKDIVKEELKNLQVNVVKEAKESAINIVEKGLLAYAKDYVVKSENKIDDMFYPTLEKMVLEYTAKVKAA